MRQVEFARTIVFDAPRHARGFFEALIADNLDLGRPHNVEIIFNRRDNGGVVVNLFYKHSRVKQYLKDGRAMRIETVINAPRDVGCNARLPNLEELRSRPVRSTPGSWMLNVSARVVSSRVQPLSGSRTPP